MMVGVMGVHSQVNFDDMEASFSDFSADVAEALPFASTIGLNWSDAKVRGFPHFGVGVTAGAVMIPEKAFTDLADSLDISLPSEITDAGIGVPFPVYVVDARLGLPFLPFDIGAKLGALTPEMSESLGSDVNADFTMAGFDLRFPILKGNLLLPAISVSTGYNYLSGGVSTTISGAGAVTNGIDLDSIITGASLTYGDPDVRFAWETHAVDVKLQASKNLLIFTPYIGGSYTYGWSKAGGGVLADITFNGATEEEIKDALDAAGYDVDLSGDGFTILSESNGGSLRAFAGVSVNLFILKLDINAMYNVLSQSLGGSANVRIAF